MIKIYKIDRKRIFIYSEMSRKDFKIFEKKTNEFLKRYRLFRFNKVIK